LTVQRIAQRYGHLMRVCRVLARFYPDRATYYLNLRSCLWARASREIRRCVTRRNVMQV
jgi:hypothetical protein